MLKQAIMGVLKVARRKIYCRVSEDGADLKVSVFVGFALQLIFCRPGVSLWWFDFKQRFAEARLSHGVRKKPQSVPLWPTGALGPGVTLWRFHCNRKWGQLSFQSTSSYLSPERHHVSSVVRDVDVVMVFRHFRPEIGLSVNPLFHWANTALIPPSRRSRCLPHL